MLETRPRRIYSAYVIPTVLVLAFSAGILTGRLAWWFVPLAGIAWAVGLSEAGTCVGGCGPSAAVLAAANAVFGVGAALGARWIMFSAGRTAT